MRPLRCAVLGAVVALAATACGSSNPDGPAQGAVTITIDSGPIHGAVDGEVRSFLGIPYAAPPVGALRFLPPKPVVPWTAAREAVGYGSPCTQIAMGAVASGTSEDCLYLNVWLPAREVTKAKVLVWIHGGGFTGGSGSDPMYGGSRIAEKYGVIVVTMNYRLGALGFLSHSSLAKAEGVTVAPSAALLDQQAALGWVHRNIAAFGGDPNAVMLAGESAGAMSVCAQLVMGGPQDHFASAAMESGTCAALSAIWVKPAAAEDMASRLATKVGCPTDDGALACLQQKSAEEIMLALPGRKVSIGPGDLFGPVVDGVTLPKVPITALRAGERRKVPVVLGSNLNEGQIFGRQWGEAAPTGDELRAIVKDVIGASTKVEEVAARYGFDGDGRAALVKMLDDVFPCSARQAARALAETGPPAYLYRFVYPYSIPALVGVVTSHAFEIPFLFRTGFVGANLNDEQLPMADVFDGYWLSFPSGDPNATRLAGTPAWPKYTKDADELLVLDLPPRTEKGTKSTECDYFDSLVP